MIRMRGRYYKYVGQIAKSIIDDYEKGLLVREILLKYKISLGGLYGLLKREGAHGTKKNVF